MNTSHLNFRIMRKARRAEDRLARWFHQGNFWPALCVAFVDLIRLACTADPTPVVKLIPGLRGGEFRLVRRRDRDAFFPYAGARRFKVAGSNAQIWIATQPTAGWLSPAMITINADDDTGEMHEQLDAVIAALVDAEIAFRISKLELAIDFALTTTVNQDFIRATGLFGKLQRDRKTKNYFGDFWGSRRSGVRVKSYQKDSIHAHRNEFVFTHRGLRRFGIRSISDIPRLASLLPGKQISFVTLDIMKLIERLRGSGMRMSATECLKIARQVVALESDLAAQLEFLRGTVGLKNSRRLLVPMPENAMVAAALRRWSKDWSPAPPGKK